MSNDEILKYVDVVVICIRASLAFYLCIYYFDSMKKDIEAKHFFKLFFIAMLILILRP